MHDPTVPADLSRYLAGLEQRVRDLERSSRLQRASAHDGTRVRVEIGTYVHPDTGLDAFGFRLVDAAGATVLILDDDGLALGAVLDASALPTSAGATGTLWVDAGAVKRA